MLKKFKKNWKEFWKAVDKYNYDTAVLVFGHRPMSGTPGTPGAKEGSHKRSLSLGSDTSGGSQTPLQKKVDTKATPTKMASNNLGGPGKGPQQPGPQDPKPGPSGSSTSGGATSGAASNYVPSLDKMAIDILPTYAHVAKEGEKKVKKEKDQFPWALYAFGIDGLSPITGRTFWTFQKFVSQKWLELPAEERKWILIEFWDYSDTYGVCAALDRYTTMWIKSLASIWVSPDNQRLKCFNRWERTETSVYKTFLRGPNWRKERSGSHFLNDLLQEAGLEGFKFTNLQWDTKSPKGVFLQFEPEPSLSAELDKREFLLMYGVTIRLKKTKRKALTEKEWFEQLGYQEELKLDEATEEEERRLLDGDDDEDENMN